MELLRFRQLECHYGAREIFAGVDGVMGDSDRIGLVGPNGAGKSSLLRLLAGVDEPYGGTIVRAKDAQMGYLAQSVADETAATLQQLVDAALERSSHDEWAIRKKRLRTMLDAFGLREADYVRPLREFSGGQRAKAALAHLLIDEPDYVILDEPTNHLDIATVRWLEEFIASDKRGYIIVSHDRYFLDRVATQIWELDRGRFHAYPPARPAYSSYVLRRDERIAAEREAYEQFVEDRDKRRATIAGLRATHTSSDYSQVRSREKQLAKVELTQQAPAPAAPAARIRVRLDAARKATSGGFAFEAESLAKAYAQPLFEELTFTLEQGSRLAIVGPNGSGKSTLLKILAGELAPDSGSVRFNPAVRAAHFAQSALDQLDIDASAIDAVMAETDISQEEARGLLGRMRISGEAAEKPVRAFSGGERRRIMLAHLMAKRVDLLLLDEPTNDLDIDSRDALESVLDDYAGAVAIVSHDRYLLNRISDRVLWIAGGAWGIVEGGYEAYEAVARSRELAERQRTGSDARTTAQSSRLTPLKVRSQLAAKVARIERDLAKMDARKAEIEGFFADANLYSDRSRVASLQAELDAIASRNAEVMNEWAQAVETLESLSTA